MKANEEQDRYLLIIAIYITTFAPILSSEGKRPQKIVADVAAKLQDDVVRMYF